RLDSRGHSELWFTSPLKDSQSLGRRAQWSVRNLCGPVFMETAAYPELERWHSGSTHGRCGIGSELYRTAWNAGERLLALKYQSGRSQISLYGFAFGAEYYVLVSRRRRHPHSL